MPGFSGTKLFAVLSALVRQARRPENLAFLPAVTLAAFWLGGEQMLILTALGVPMLLLIAGAVRYTPSAKASMRFPQGMVDRTNLIAQLGATLREAERIKRTTACLVLHMDGMRELADMHGHAAHAEVIARSAERLHSALRETDTLSRLEGDSFAVALSPMPRADLDGVLQLAERLQGVLSDPIGLDHARLYVSASVGFCLALRAPEEGAAALLEAAEAAADAARQAGPGCIRVFSNEMRRVRADRAQLRKDLETALESGEIVPHFQPQISTDTGEVSGFEALARWNHPKRGCILPADFLPLIDEAGLSERLGEVILFRSLTALTGWDSAGLRVPNVAVNFSHQQLRNPRLADTLKWELDRFELTPDRLTLEILETVVAETDNDTIVHNMAALSKLGCGIDLDDFGTGHAAIANIRRFAVRRIKIDRTFVTHVDDDPGQQKMVAAILSMADRLGLETLAEGVETTGEHTMLAQLGCSHIQGFGVARPMPYEDTFDWVRTYTGRLTDLPRIGRHAI